MKKRHIQMIISGTLLSAMLFAVSACGTGSSGITDSASELKSAADMTNEQNSEGDTKESQTDVPNKVSGQIEINSVNEHIEEEKFDLFNELSGWQFELASAGNYESNWRTWITINKDGTFSGSFLKDYYVKTADGEVRTDADGEFTGKLGECRQKDEYTYEADVEELEYTLSAEVPKEYSEASGLESYDDGGITMTFYLPGKSAEELPVDVSSSLFGNDFGAYVGTDLVWVEDQPDDLPFYTLVTDDAVFSGTNISAANDLYIVNRTRLMEIVNMDCWYGDDGTYYCMDGDENGNVRFVNTCIKYEGFNFDVAKCIEEIYGDKDIEYLSVYEEGVEDDWIYKPGLKWLNGMQSKYAMWSLEKNGKNISYQGRFISPYIDDHRFVFAYIVELSGGSEAVDGETASFALESLSFSGRKEDISCGGGTIGEPYKKILVLAKSGQGNFILGDEVEFVSEDQTDKIKKYNLDPDDFYDDYQIGGIDGIYEEFTVSEDCPIYVQYAPDGMHRLISLKDFSDYIKPFESDNGILMDLVLDRSGNVILIKEPYTP